MASLNFGIFDLRLLALQLVTHCKTLVLCFYNLQPSSLTASVELIRVISSQSEAVRVHIFLDAALFRARGPLSITVLCWNCRFLSYRFGYN